MKKTITLYTFRKVGQMEETMMRAVMPRTDALDPVAAPVRVVRAPRCWANGRLVLAPPPLTCTLAEVAHV